MTHSQFEVEGWPWNPDKCPADEQFINWLLSHKHVLNGSVFHMGPGLHHRVGRTCNVLHIPCSSITISKEEWASTPEIFGYEVVLDDVCLYDFRRVSGFQIMTLFHLGEMPGTFVEPTRDILFELISHVRQGGLVMFYQKSSAWSKIEPLVANLLGDFRGTTAYLKVAQGYKDLLVTVKI